MDWGFSSGVGGWGEWRYDVGARSIVHSPPPCRYSISRSFLKRMCFPFEISLCFCRISVLIHVSLLLIFYCALLILFSYSHSIAMLLWICSRKLKLAYFFWPFFSKCFVHSTFTFKEMFRICL